MVLSNNQRDGAIVGAGVATVLRCIKGLSARLAAPPGQGCALLMAGRSTPEGLGTGRCG
jgi:hypothetical protein